MNTFKLSNIPLDDFRRFLKEQKCECQNSSGSGHEKWVREGITRPATIQSHFDPVPEHIVQNTLRNLGFTRKMFEEYRKQKLKASGKATKVKPTEN